jgi:acyl-CoA synthetase (AMP-forming)/AMP-acid ligase II
VVGVLGALVGGHRVIVDRRFAASTFWDVVERTGATWLNLVPAIISVLAVRAAPAASATARVGFARSASAPLPQATRERFEKVTGVGVLETYGMTEAGSQIAANPRSQGERRPGSVGVAVGLELRVVDGSRQCLPPGVVGQVEIRGANVVSEYWAPAGTAGTARPACRADGWLATGDLGRVDDDGYVYLAGRDDDVINRGGEKVYPRQVEEVLFAEAGVAEAAVVGRTHPIVGEEPVAFVVAAPGTDRIALEARLRARCETELSRFRRPAEILLVASLPSGLNGKVRRADLRALVCSPQGQRPSRPGPRPSHGHTPELAPVASRSGR